jgi:hypothetical protein
MRIVLDECVPSKLSRSFVGHEVTTVPQRGWAGSVNGELLARLEEANVDIFVTVDKN